jgi:DNA-binding transcriptional regulator GbsR (MarR family)
MAEELQNREKQFVEEVGIAFARTGLPRMAGRIVGWLLISDPPHQSIDQIASALLASKGSISTSTRILVQNGLIERFSLPGVRHDYFRLRADAWSFITGRHLEEEIRTFRHLAERGLEVFTDKMSPTRKWLEEMQDVYSFIERELPALQERWEKQHKGAG